LTVTEYPSCHVRWVAPSPSLAPLDPLLPETGLRLETSDVGASDAIPLSLALFSGLVIALFGSRASGLRPSVLMTLLAAVGAVQLCSDILVVLHAFERGDRASGGAIALVLCTAVVIFASIAAAIHSTPFLSRNSLPSRAADELSILVVQITKRWLPTVLLLVVAAFDVELLRCLPWKSTRWDGLPSRQLLFLCTAIAAVQTVCSLGAVSAITARAYADAATPAYIWTSLAVSTCGLLLRVVRVIIGQLLERAGSVHSFSCVLVTPAPATCSIVSDEPVRSLAEATTAEAAAEATRAEAAAGATTAEAAAEATTAEATRLSSGFVHYSEVAVQMPVEFEERRQEREEQPIAFLEQAGRRAQEKLGDAAHQRDERIHVTTRGPQQRQMGWLEGEMQHTLYV